MFSGRHNVLTRTFWKRAEDVLLLSGSVCDHKGLIPAMKILILHSLHFCCKHIIEKKKKKTSSSTQHRFTKWNVFTALKELPLSILKAHTRTLLTDNHHHHHVICTNSKAITCYSRATNVTKIPHATEAMCSMLSPPEKHRWLQDQARDEQNEKKKHRKKEY